MENRFEHINPEEKQGWGAYATPPPYSSINPQQRPDGVAVLQCGTVRDNLQPFLENDGTIAPEMWSMINRHLAGCVRCAREYDTLRHLIAVLDALPPAPLPMDYSGIIMRRIQSEMKPYATETPPNPMQAASLPRGGEAAVSADDRPLFRQAVVASGLNAGPAAVFPQRVGFDIQYGRTARFCGATWERLALAGVLGLLLLAFLSTPWVREMLLANLEQVRSLLRGALLGVERNAVPALGSMLNIGVAALSGLGGALAETFRAMSGLTAQALVMDGVVCAVIALALFACGRTTLRA